MFFFQGDLPLMRRSISWVVMQTSPKGEEEAKLGVLAKRLSSLSNINTQDIYVPILRGGSIRATFLIEGYIFVKSGYPSTSYWDLARSIYIEKMISQYDNSSDMISISTISDRNLKEMIAEAYKLGGNYKVGDKVEIVDGDFKGCTGVVQTIIKEDDDINGGGFYTVLLNLRSAEVIVTVDVFSLGDQDG